MCAVFAYKYSLILFLEVFARPFKTRHINIHYIQYSKDGYVFGGYRSLTLGSGWFCWLDNECNDTIRTKLCIQNVDRCCWWFQALSNWIQLVPWCAGTTTSCSGAPWPWFLHGVVMQSVSKPGWKGENQTHNQEKVLRILWVQYRYQWNLK